MKIELPPSQYPELPLAGDGAKDFEELFKEGFVPFALGPIYVYAGVKEDIVRRFCAEIYGKEQTFFEIHKPTSDGSRHQHIMAGVPEDVVRTFAGANKVTKHVSKLDPRGCHLTFDSAVLTRCEQWNYTLNILDAVSFIHFKVWMLSQQFVDYNEKRFYLPRHFSVPILDPLALNLKGIAIPATLDVFSLSGMKGILKPQTAAKALKDVSRYVIFEHQPPEEDTIKLGAAALAVIRRS